MIRELLFRNFSHPRGETSPARHGYYLSIASWLISGLIAVAFEVAFLGAVFLAASLYIAWRYGRVLSHDCDHVVAALGEVGEGRFAVKIDASRPDELDRVAHGARHGRAAGAVQSRPRSSRRPDAPPWNRHSPR